jgi:hypothetical protein
MHASIELDRNMVLLAYLFLNVLGYLSNLVTLLGAQINLLIAATRCVLPTDWHTVNIQ